MCSILWKRVVILGTAVALEDQLLWFQSKREKDERTQDGRIQSHDEYRKHQRQRKQCQLEALRMRVRRFVGFNVRVFPLSQDPRIAPVFDLQFFAHTKVDSSYSSESRKLLICRSVLRCYTLQIRRWEGCEPPLWNLEFSCGTKSMH
jgi:hypothetical protein